MGLIIGLATYVEDIVKFIVGKSNRRHCTYYFNAGITLETGEMKVEGMKQ